MLIVKQGDRYQIQFFIEDRDAVVDLTGATVRLLARRRMDGGAAVELPTVIISATGGVVGHTLNGAMDALGVWDMEIEITNGAGITTGPTNGVVSLRVVADLG